MAGPVKSPWTAPGQPQPPTGQPAPAGQVGSAWQGGTSTAPFAGVGGPQSPWLWHNPAPEQPQSSWGAPAPVLGAAASPTDPNAGVWNPETRTAVDPRGAATAANQNLRGYGSFAGPGSYPGAGAQPAPPPGELEGPGALEQAYAEHGGEFFAPGPSQQFFENNQGAFTQPGSAEQYFNKISGAQAPRAENRADQAFDTYQREMPAMLEAPDLGSYYDVAEERAQRSLADAQAARGVFGSSVASGQAGDISRGLNAERANREADYNLARNADRRATLEGLSGAGRAGDITDLANAGNEMGWRAMLGNLAGSADANALGRLGLGVSASGAASGERRGGLSAGMSAAGLAQGAEEGRLRGGLQDVAGLYSMLSSLGLGTYGDELAADSALQDAVLGGGIAGASNAYNMDEANRQQFFGDVGALGNVATGLGALGWKPFSADTDEKKGSGRVGRVGGYPVIPYGGR